MESWRKVWRDGFMPGFSTEGLRSLRQALRADDFQLLQGASSFPPPEPKWLQCRAEGACAIGIGMAGSAGLGLVGTVEETFARACFEADCRLGEPAASRWFLNWYDAMPREHVRRHLLAEVERELHCRHADEFTGEQNYAVAAA